MNELTIQSALKKFFGFNAFKGLQESVIQNVLDKKDSFVIMPTGGGKSMCYQLPALMQEGTAIVVSPLIALMKISAFGETIGGKISITWDRATV